MQMQHVVWLPRAVRDEMCLDADRWYEKETGGTFMGYRAEPNVAVVTAMIPGGPSAVRERHSFLPDLGWQHAEIASHYEQSGRLDTYLGDWHTHPGAVSGSLSWKDRACLKRIIKTPAARNPTPIMMLMCGDPRSWVLHSWVARLGRQLLFFDLLSEDEAAIEVYD